MAKKPERRATTVGAVLCASHRARDGRLHGHTWRVWVRCPYTGGDAEALRGCLQKELAHLDHCVLPTEISNGEDLAQYVGFNLNAAGPYSGFSTVDYVKVERAGEMIIGEWWAS